MKPKHLVPSVTAFAVAAYVQHIVVLTPDTADIVVAFGSPDEIVGRDQTVQNLVLQSKPSISIYRRLTVEPTIAAKSDIAIGSWMIQPTDIFTRLKTAGVNAVNVAPDDSTATYPQSICHIGQFIGESMQADKIVSRWQADMKQQPVNSKRRLFSYDGRIVSGRNTAVGKIIRRIGGINATAIIDGLKSMTREAWIAAKLDIIVIADHNAAMIGSTKVFAARPEIAGSPVAKSDKIYLWKVSNMFHYELDTSQVMRRLNGLVKQAMVLRRPMFQPGHLIPRCRHSCVGGTLS